MFPFAAVIAAGKVARDAARRRRPEARDAPRSSMCRSVCVDPTDKRPNRCIQHAQHEGAHRSSMLPGVGLRWTDQHAIP